MQIVKKSVLFVGFVLVFLVSFFDNSKISAKPKQGTDFVNLFVGTANDQGQLDPSATVPYGMVKVGPDCIPPTHVGYDYEISEISGFSINRLSGVGCNGAGGNLSVRPSLPDTKLEIVKTSEKACPGYYSTKLNNGTTVELTATNRVALEKFRFGNKDKHPFYIDFSKSFAEWVGCNFKVISNHEISGWISARNTCDKGKYTFYFDFVSKNQFRVKDKNKKTILLEFDENHNAIEFRIGISGISVEDARISVKNIQSKSFSTIAKNAFQLWQDKINRVEVFGNDEDKVMFYSSLYRTFLTPVNVTSNTGSYINSKGQLENSDQHSFYSSLSIWDTYRTKFPLITLLDAKAMNDICWSLCKLYESGKAAWSTDFETTPTTRTEHSAILLLDAYMKGIQNIDFEKCYRNIEEETLNLPLNSPDNYLESAYDYWALSQIAKILNKNDDFEKHASKATELWQSIWKEKFQKIDFKTFDVMHGDGLYEGTLWQYRWAVPYDIDGLCQLAGGKDSLKDQLQYFFENNLYNQGNEPDIHTPYIFNEIGYPKLTQFWVHKILTQPMKHAYGTHSKFASPYFEKAFKPIPRSYIPEMDDDDGTMAAWYVFSAMGIYPLEVGKPCYEITSPLFDRVILHLSDNKTFQIICHRSSKDSFYIQKAVLNGKILSHLQIFHQDLVNGGVLELYLE